MYTMSQSLRVQIFGINIISKIKPIFSHCFQTQRTVIETLAYRWAGSLIRRERTLLKKINPILFKLKKKIKVFLLLCRFQILKNLILPEKDEAQTAS